MYGLAVILSVATLNICQILMRLIRWESLVFCSRDLLTFRNQEAALHCDMYLHHLLFNLISTGQWTHFPTYIIKSPRKTFHCFNFLSNNLLAKQIILYTRDLLSLDSWRASQRKSMITSQTSKRQTFVI